MNKQKFKGTTLYRKRCIDNILRVYKNNQFEGGESWYAEANKLAQRLAKQYGVGVLQVSGVIASLSPLKTWEENKKLATQFLAEGDAKHTRAMVKKAKAIVSNTEDRDFILTTLNGNKISSFFENIAYPNEVKTATIDRHAISICLGRSIVEREGVGITDKQYEFFVSCYKDASNILDTIPNVVQSVTWVKWRKLKQLKIN